MDAGCKKWVSKTRQLPTHSKNRHPPHSCSRSSPKLKTLVNDSTLMRRTTSGSVRDELPNGKHHLVTAPDLSRGRRETHGSRHGSPSRMSVASGRTLPAITPGNGGPYGPLSNTATQEPLPFSRHSTSRSGHVEGLHPDFKHLPPPKPDPRGPSGSYPAPDTFIPKRVHAVEPQRSSIDYTQDLGQTNGSGYRPPLTIPDPRSLPPRTSPSSTTSPYAPQSGISTYGSQSHGPLGLPPHTPSSQSSRATSVAAGPTAVPTQYMTVETSHGQMQIPMDVQGASRVADEKRRRNAGASARFRQRRKEKEMASSREIEDLKQRIHDLGEDCDFYRKERDVLMAALYNSTEGSRLFPRPTSPRRHRSIADPSSQSEEGQDSPQMQNFEERGEKGANGAHTRRRLDSSPPQYAPYQSHTPTNHFAQQPLPQQPATLPPLQPHNHQSSTQLPQIRSYGGFNGSQAGSVSPWQYASSSQTPQSQTHSRSESSTRSYHSGA